MATIPTLVFGGATITADDGSFSNAADVSSLLETLKAEGIFQLDTAQFYGGGTSEQLIGLLRARRPLRRLLRMPRAELLPRRRFGMVSALCLVFRLLLRRWGLPLFSRGRYPAVVLGLELRRKQAACNWQSAYLTIIQPILKYDTKSMPATSPMNYSGPFNITFAIFLPSLGDLK